MAQYTPQQEYYRLGDKDAVNGREPLWPVLEAAGEIGLAEAYKRGYFSGKKRAGRRRL